MILAKASSRLNILTKSEFILDRRSLKKKLFFLHQIPLEYADIIWDNISLELVQKLENINIEAARIVSGLQDWHQLKDFFKKQGGKHFQQGEKATKLLSTIKWCRPLPFVYHYSSSAKKQLIHQYPTCQGHYYSDIECHSNHYMNSFLPSTTRLWNKLPYIF